MDKVKERRRLKAIARSKAAQPSKRKERDEDSINRLKRYNFKKILFRNFGFKKELK